MATIIKLHKITKSYKTEPKLLKVLDGISFEVKQGEFIAITGKSGSGKSTLLHILGLLDRPTKGNYLLDGEAIIPQTPSSRLAYLRRQKIGFIFQMFNLLPRASAIDNVELPMVYNRTPARKQKAKELLKKVELGHRLYHYPNQLSGGEQQRVAIARALANNPQILLADEPTGNLDSKSGTTIIKLIKQLHGEGLTVVMVTHEKEIAAAADRVVELKDGKVVS